MSLPDSPLAYVAYDLATGNYKGRLPLSGVTFGSQINTPGSASGSLDIASPAVQMLGALDLTAPARTALAIDYLGALIWTGVVWPRDYTFDDTKRTLQVTATELWSYPASRMQAADYSSPPYSTLTGIPPAGSVMPIWDATGTDQQGVYDPVLIAWQLISDALTQVRYGNILGGMSIAANGFTSASAYLASGTAVPLANYLSVNYPYASIQQLGSIIPMLAGNGYGYGFDVTVDAAYSAGPGSPPAATVNLSYPRRGRLYSQNALVLNCASAISYQLPEDGTQTGNRVYEQGSSGSLGVSENLQPLQGGYPLLEQLKSRANIQSANIPTVLSSLGASDLAVASYPVATPSVTMDLFSSTAPLGDFIVGDNARWIVPATDGAGSVFDPRLPQGLDEEWRITGYQATVADEGQSKIVFQLALPPSTTIGAPALP